MLINVISLTLLIWFIIGVLNIIIVTNVIRIPLKDIAGDIFVDLFLLAPVYLFLMLLAYWVKKNRKGRKIYEPH